MIHTGDCVEVMRGMPADSVDAVVTDPPYGLEFMGKEWDKFSTTGAGFSKPGIGERPTEWVSSSAKPGISQPNPTCSTCGGRARGKRRCDCTEPQWKPLGPPRSTTTERVGDAWPTRTNLSQMRSYQSWCEVWAREAFRVLKPGGYLLAFGGTRTVHRLASAIEDAGFEIRDELVWIYASGFPKSLDVGKAMDRAAGAEREATGPGQWASVRGTRRGSSQGASNGGEQGGYNMKAAPDETAPSTDLAKQWDGWGTALKPAHEPIVMARKPLIGTVAGNVAKYGTGALNIEETRIGMEATTRNSNAGTNGDGWGMGKADHVNGSKAGRWPSNVLLSDPELFDQPNPYVVGSGAMPHSQDPATRANKRHGSYFGGIEEFENPGGYGDSGGYARFFLVPKADRADREPTLRGQLTASNPGVLEGSKDGSLNKRTNGNPPAARENAHPTVKPTDLMRHLVRLVTPPGGTVLDCFLGSGSTAIACELEGFPWIGIEREPEYVAIAEARLNGVQRGLGLDVPAPTKAPPKTHPDLSKHQPKRRAPAENWSGPWAGTGNDEEPAA